MQITDKMREYWQRNLRLTWILLAIWFVVSYGVVFFAESLHKITIFGFPLSFYMGAQGALIVFVVVIAVYAKKMNAMDREYGVHEED